MPAPLTLKEIDRLGELLAKIPAPYLSMEPDVLDGYLTAIALMRRPPEQANWLPFVFDAEGRPEAHLSAEAQSELRKLVLRRGAEIEGAILSETPIDPIVFDVEDEEGNPVEGIESIAALSGFASGFSGALSLWPELIKNTDKAVQAALVGILRYEELESEDEEELQSILESINAEVGFADLDEALQDLASCVQEIAEVTRKEDIERAGRSAQKKPPRRR